MDVQVFDETFHLLDNLPLGICVIDEGYNILFWNTCLEAWTKRSSAEMIGRNLASAYPHFGEKRYSSRIDPILVGGPPTIFSSQLHGHLFDCELPNGKSRILQTTVSNVSTRKKGEFHALFAVTDLTELSYRIIDYRKIQQKALEEIEQRKVVENELRKANEKIVAQHKAVIEEERLKVLLQMAGATAHELNQPLMILLGNIELLEMECEDPHKLRDRIRKINKAGIRISEIIKKIQKVKHVVKKDYSGGDDIIDIHQKEKILCVEDDHACYELIRKMLAYDSSRVISHADSLEKAKSCLNKSKFDLILLDYILPDGDAFGLLEFLKLEQINTPVIVVTGYGDEVTASHLFRKGVSDYLSKALLDRKTLVESIELSLERHYLSQDKEKAMLVMGALSTMDELTGLYNRRYFDEAFKREASGMERYDYGLALCMIDIDHFKVVNDTHGHATGDEVLKKISAIIKAAVRKYDIACRYGGEEFALILPRTDRQGAEKLCNRIRENLAAYLFEYRTGSFQVTLSAGIALKSSGDDHIVPMIQQADTALYQAKARGRNKVVLFEQK